MNSPRTIESVLNGANKIDGATDLVCFSHLRWDFVYQRPQHLLTRAARERRVFFVEEPIFSSNPNSDLDISQRESGVWVVVPHLEASHSEAEVTRELRSLIDRFFADAKIELPIAWYYTPMALGFTDHLHFSVTVYDCMDELSLFKHAPQSLKDRESQLFRRADLVFTGGQSLYEAKKDQHHSVHAFPSSIEYAHFAQARTSGDSVTSDPPDQASIPHPRMGFFGVIDERMDIELLAGVAQARPDWHLVMLGPIVKIDPKDLPSYPNIHYLGGKSYKELPQYLAGWDVAMLPFAKNDSTKFISPTKTPEYLAAGKPVVSTSITDVVRPYGEMGMVKIADTVDEFIRAAAEIGMDEAQESEEWLNTVDKFLGQTSWDATWKRMSELIQNTRMMKQTARERPNQKQAVKTVLENFSEPAISDQVKSSSRFAY